MVDMPRWDFYCHTCERKVEYQFNVGDPGLLVCPVCGQKLERLPSAPNFTIKGYSAKNGYSK